MSRFSAIESSGYDVVNGIAALNGNVKLVAAGLMGSVRPSDSGVGAVCALLDPVKAQPSMVPSFGFISLRYKCTFRVILLAVSDGREIGDARGSAWELADTCMDAFTKPTWVPAVPTDVTVYPPEIDGPYNVMDETAGAGVMLDVIIDIEWRT